MTGQVTPIPRTGPHPDNALPLAGSRHLWFDHVSAYGATGRTLPNEALTPQQHASLSGPRATLCGLSLDRPRVMGILNVTPDSFSDGGEVATTQAALERAQAMTAADILDIGGESTRPGADTVPVSQEIDRTVPVIAALRAAGITKPISIDTRKAAVAAAALDAGADMVNDVSAMTFDPDMAPLVASRGVPVCLMHAQGDPKTMQDNPSYDDVVLDVAQWLADRTEAAERSGIARERIIIDPGIGFGKTLAHNVALLRHVGLFHNLGCPILLGVSRKGFIGTLGGAKMAKERMPGSLAAALYGAGQGVQILRVHDVNATGQALKLFLAINGGA